MLILVNKINFYNKLKILFYKLTQMSEKNIFAQIRDNEVDSEIIYKNNYVTRSRY